jgi:choline dehydrogenase-like flavoprotein
MGAIRGEAEDYDGWAAQGCDGWDWASVLPLFRALEDDPLAATDPEAHGSGGPIPIYRPPIDGWGAVGKATLRAALALGHTYDEDLNRPSGTGVSPFPINSKPDAISGEQIRWSVNDGYLEPLRDAGPAVEIRAGCHVSRLRFDNAEAPQRVVGVELVEVMTGRVYEENAEEVIVSCGAVQSPALLQRSGIGPRSVLEPLGIPVVRDLPVGESMQDHPTIGCQMQLKKVRPVD